MAFTGRQKQAILFGIWKPLRDQGASGDKTLLAGIEGYSAAQGNTLAAGKVQTSVSGNGYSASFGGEQSQGDAAELGGELIQLYEDCLAALTTPTDQQIYDEMRWRLRPQSVMQVDYTQVCYA